MNYKLHITGKAQQDLVEAADYIEFILYNPTAADALLEEAGAEFHSLTFMPEKHALAEDPVLRVWGIRFITVKNYLAFYTIDEEVGIVYVIRFLHSKREWATLLRKGTDLK